MIPVKAQLPEAVEGPNQLCAMVEAPDMEKLVSEKEKLYYGSHLHVADAMKNLTQVGSLLQVAYAASKGHECSVSVMKVLGNYQTLTHDSKVVTGSFVQACVEAVGSHILARDIATEGEVGTALELLGECKTLAGKMVKASGEIVDKSTVLVELAQTALQQAVKDESMGVKNREEILKRIDEQKALEKKMQSTSASLTKSVEVAEKRERELASKLDEERHRNFVLNMIDGIVKPAAEVAKAYGNPQINIPPPDQDSSSNPYMPEADRKGMGTMEALAESERQAAQDRIEFQNQLREANAKLQESVQRLKDLKVGKNRMDQAVKSLETVVLTMGKVKTIFENVRTFWMGVKKHCEALENQGQIEKLAKNERLKNLFIQKINSSGFNWAVLGKICMVAHESVTQSTGHVDRIMSNLPTEDQVPKILNNVSKGLLEDLKLERKALEEGAKPA